MKKKSILIKESADTSESSWIINATYVTLDWISGSLILKTSSEEEYVHVAVPIKIWQRFKDSISKGAAYNQYIKNKFKIIRLN